MKRIIKQLSLLFLLCAVTLNAMAIKAEVDSIPPTQWKGKKVAILGDSMSDPKNNPDEKRFYTYLSETLGIQPLVYAQSGYQWKDLYGFAQQMKAEHGDDLDAIFIWAGTNDYNASRPIGEFFTESEKNVNANGKIVKRKHRTPIISDSTFCGSINLMLAYLKENFPTKQIIILTPIHRGFAQFSATNVQPDELYANQQDLYIDDYVDVLKRAGMLWSVPVIDLFSYSGLYPLYESNNSYIIDEKNDRLHPNSNGHKRLAETLRYQLLAIPVDL